MTLKEIDWTRAAQAGLWYVLGLFVIVAIVYIGLSYGIALMGDVNIQLVGGGIIAQFPAKNKHVEPDPRLLVCHTNCGRYHRVHLPHKIWVGV